MIFKIPTELPAVFTRDLEDMTVSIGGDADFICEVSREDAKVTWYCDDQEVQPSDKYQIVKKDKKHTLYVKDATSKDTCKITAKIPGHETSAQLTVEGRSLFTYHEIVSI